jgi:hypothetical protein
MLRNASRTAVIRNGQVRSTLPPVDLSKPSRLSGSVCEEPVHSIPRREAGIFRFELSESTRNRLLPSILPRPDHISEAVSPPFCEAFAVKTSRGRCSSERKRGSNCARSQIQGRRIPARSKHDHDP